MTWIRPVQQILTRTHLRVDNRIPISAKFRQQNRIRGRILASATAVARASRPGDLHHGRGDAQGAVIRPLGATGIGDALGAAFFSGDGDAAGDAGGDDAAQVEAELGAYFDGDGD